MTNRQDSVSCGVNVPLLLLVITTEREDYFGMSAAILLLKLKTTAFSFITSDPGDDTTSMTNSAFPFGSVSEPARKNSY